MPGILKSLRVLSEPTRVRLLLLLQAEELSVAELQQILAKGQSQISTHLAQLKQAGLVTDQREGKNIYYSLRQLPAHVLAILRDAAKEIPETEDDADALKLMLERRRDRMRSYFDELAGRFGREYVPGRSWEGLAECLLALLPAITVADLGAGEGTVSQLLARRAKHVIAIDNSPKMVEFGSDLARRHGLSNLEYRLGDLESVPLADAQVDLTLFSQSLHHAQHPQRAIDEAWRIRKPGGRLAILDLLRHQFEEAREMYADVWLGFTEVELRRFLEHAGFVDLYSAVVHRQPEAPHFETVLAVATKAA